MVAATSSPEVDAGTGVVVGPVVKQDTGGGWGGWWGGGKDAGGGEGGVGGFGGLVDEIGNW